MKRPFFYTLLALSSILSNDGFANLPPEMERFGIQGELVYLQPSADATIFATQRISSTTTKNLYHKAHHKAGYRVEGTYVFDCKNNLHGRVTYFNSGNNLRSVSGSFVFGAPLQFTGTVEDNINFCYKVAEILYGRQLFDCENFNLEMAAGLVYTDVKYTENLIASGPAITTSRGFIQSKFWGLGPELVWNFLYTLPFDLCCNRLAFAADARIGLLYSRTKPVILGADGFNLLSETFSAIVPTVDFRLGFNWRCICNCMKFHVEAGYEWIFVHRALIKNPPISSNLTFQGPYASVGISF